MYTIGRALACHGWSLGEVCWIFGVPACRALFLVSCDCVVAYWCKQRKLKPHAAQEIRRKRRNKIWLDRAPAERTAATGLQHGEVWVPGTPTEAALIITLNQGGGQHGKSKSPLVIRLSKTPKTNPKNNLCSKSLSTIGAKLVVFQPFTV